MSSQKDDKNDKDDKDDKQTSSLGSSQSDKQTSSIQESNGLVLKSSIEQAISFQNKQHKQHSLFWNNISPVIDELINILDNPTQELVNNVHRCFQDGIKPDEISLIPELIPDLAFRLLKCFVESAEKLDLTPIQNLMIEYHLIRPSHLMEVRSHAFGLNDQLLKFNFLSYLAMLSEHFPKALDFFDTILQDKQQPKKSWLWEEAFENATETPLATMLQFRMVSRYANTSFYNLSNYYIVNTCYHNVYHDKAVSLIITRYSPTFLLKFPNLDVSHDETRKPEDRGFLFQKLSGLRSHSKLLKYSLRAFAYMVEDEITRIDYGCENAVDHIQLSRPFLMAAYAKGCNRRQILIKIANDLIFIPKDVISIMIEFSGDDRPLPGNIGVIANMKPDSNGHFNDSLDLIFRTQDFQELVTDEYDFVAAGKIQGELDLENIYYDTSPPFCPIQTLFRIMMLIPFQRLMFQRNSPLRFKEILQLAQQRSDFDLQMNTNIMSSIQSICPTQHSGETFILSVLQALSYKSINNIWVKAIQWQNWNLVLTILAIDSQTLMTDLYQDIESVMLFQLKQWLSSKDKTRPAFLEKFNEKFNDEIKTKMMVRCLDTNAENREKQNQLRSAMTIQIIHLFADLSTPTNLLIDAYLMPSVTKQDLEVITEPFNHCLRCNTVEAITKAIDQSKMRKLQKTNTNLLVLV